MFGNSSKARLARNHSKVWMKYDIGDEVGHL